MVVISEALEAGRIAFRRGRNYPPQTTQCGVEGSRGPVAAGKKINLTLGPKTSSGRGPYGVFCRGGTEFEVTPVVFGESLSE